jgi:uracil-DNA glycosylase family 4
MPERSRIEQIHADIKRCTLCPLHKTRTNAVPGEGSENSRLVFVGEAPGAREDESGMPFVGRSGQLLTSMIEEIDLKRDDVFITSILKCRPPGNRPPLKSEINACLPYLRRQIDTINPKFVVLLGGVAISSLIGPWTLSEAHGRFYEDGTRTYFMTYHPAAALRFPKTGETMRADFRVLERELLGA